MEINGVTAIAIHALGITLVIARASHALGLKADTIANPGRFAGAAGTLLVMLTLSIWSIVSSFPG